jgi:hypothetical protein
LVVGEEGVSSSVWLAGAKEYRAHNRLRAGFGGRQQPIG